MKREGDEKGSGRDMRGRDTGKEVREGDREGHEKGRGRERRGKGEK